MIANVSTEENLKQNIVSLPFVSAYTFRYYADHGWISGVRNSKFIDQLPNGINPSEVKEGDTIFLATELLDQFFDEQQWESYRKLGEHIGNKVFV